MRGDFKDRSLIEIVLLFSDEYLENVSKVSGPHKIWNAIRNVSQRQNLLKKLSAKPEFYTFKMIASEKVLMYKSRAKEPGSSSSQGKCSSMTGNKIHNAKNEYRWNLCGYSWWRQNYVVSFKQTLYLRKWNVKRLCSDCGREGHTASHCWGRDTMVKVYIFLQANF